MRVCLALRREPRPDGEAGRKQRLGHIQHSFAVREIPKITRSRKRTGQGEIQRAVSYILVAGRMVPIFCPKRTKNLPIFKRNSKILSSFPGPHGGLPGNWD